MTVNIKTPIGIWISIRPDVYSDVCPIFYPAGCLPPFPHRKATRRYCNAEGWIDLAERRIVEDPEVSAFLNSIEIAK